MGFLGGWFNKFYGMSIWFAGSLNPNKHLQTVSE